MSTPGRPASSRHLLGVWIRSLLWTFAESVVAILLAVVLGGIGIFLFSGLLPNHSAFDLGLPIAAYGALWSGALGYPNGVGSTLSYATPLILAGLGVGLGFKAGLFNIGGRGQFLMGAIGAMAVVTFFGQSLPVRARVAHLPTTTGPGHATLLTGSAPCLDGIVGNATLFAVNSANQRGLHEAIFQARGRFILDLVKNHPEQNKFLDGWMNRLNQFKFVA